MWNSGKKKSKFFWCVLEADFQQISSSLTLSFHLDSLLSKIYCELSLPQLRQTATVNDCAVRNSMSNEAFKSYFYVKVLDEAGNSYGSSKVEVDLVFVLLLANYVFVSAHFWIHGHTMRVKLYCSTRVSRGSSRVSPPMTTKQISAFPCSYHCATRCCLFGLAACLTSDCLISQSSSAAAPGVCWGVSALRACWLKPN